MESSKKSLKTPTLPVSIAKALKSSKAWFGPRCRVPNPDVVELSKRDIIFMSSKQVPTCLALKGAGNPSLYSNLRLLQRKGFPLQGSIGWNHWFTVGSTGTDEHLISVSQVKAMSEYLSSVQNENLQHPLTGPDRFFSPNPVYGEEDQLPTPDELDQEEEALDWDFPIEEVSEDSKLFESLDKDEKEDTKRVYRIDYTDPFKANASVAFARSQGRKGPVIRNWPADVIRLTDRIPSRLLGPEWTARRKDGVPFHEISNLNCKLFVLLKHTHWGSALMRMCAPENEGCCFARRLRRRIRNFLTGLHDPVWNNRDIESFYGSREYVTRDQKKRAARFIQMLHTVDGFLMQKYMSNLEAEWSWETFDLSVIGLISVFITDEFHDGEIVNEDLLEVNTFYGALKSLRKEFKQAANMRVPLDLWEPSGLLPEMMHESYMHHERVRSADDIQELIIRGILSQTRCAGTPPHLVVIQSKLKLLNTLTDPVSPVPQWEMALMSGAVDKLISTVPDSALTGLETKAGVKAASSSCYENTRKEGGTTQAVSDLVFEGSMGRECQILDLETGAVLGSATADQVTTGEYVFWRSLEEVLATEPEELKTVSVVMAAEPGKARAVTKGRASLKVVLDVVNSLCAWPLAKGVVSSVSGMGKESHAWNFVRATFTEFHDLVFSEKTVETEVVDEKLRLKTVTYHEVAALSTDYETATDWAHHQIGEMLGEKWMQKCGIPRLLRAIVRQTCFRPRWVEFLGTGVLGKIGEPCPSENIRRIRMVRGILMGDPLTKVVLHLLNASVRILAEEVCKAEFLSNVCTNPGELAHTFPPEEKKTPRVVL